MHLHILGIAGTFMGGLALLARELGHRVSGSDTACYPPMGTMLQAAGIEILTGYDPAQLQPPPDLVLIGNALSRGNPAVEYVLDQRLPYQSGAEWVADALLRDRRVIAVAGTHGKTTTSSMIAWVLEAAGRAPGFLIGGQPENFSGSARLGAAPWFVVEADEYDTAFFDKRAKFVHYRPEILVINNIELDHVDIYPDIAAVRRQFHHLVRTVPGNGHIVRPADDAEVDSTLAMGCWTPQSTFGAVAGAEWEVRPLNADASSFRVARSGTPVGQVDWQLCGAHNACNAAAAIAASVHAGIPAAAACAALARFRPPRRRLERVADVGGIVIYDDFAHHPTAIAATLAALRSRVGEQRIVAVLEPRSNTMRMGVMRDRIAPALRDADRVVVYAPPGLAWDAGAALAPLGARCDVCGDIDAVIATLARMAQPGDHVLMMSNGDFGGIHARLAERLRAAAQRRTGLSNRGA
ncbi:MAG: UDP-N-acetylmuramate:L-alanyl-gamma-D-glutamyl-meso-diaminopimelate ligase [Gammaproteobacteria bacterium]|nr:UDP-N-acetylmuramate:L-alanyl-gamma-D-glutamyl-meso-diaminopimelate ligase [Gammaproteobacteria bacterium]